MIQGKMISIFFGRKVRVRRIAICLAVAISAVSLSGCERYWLDRKMEELCRKDGGVKIYETVTLSPPEYEELSKYAVTKKSIEDYYGPEYRYVLKREVIVGNDNVPEKGRGQLVRWYSAIYRRSDNRLLGESISYDRSGGDLFTFGFQPSGNICPRPRVSLQHSIFLKGV